ncbi:LuxR C-terminal-related transcriptional regulator [Streptomyces sp. NPDC051909]|uniref:LuxR C-terminal-related transcriptional regulator n=1 Tax=Streptomyces sp. NPDC051909 TaxID=3154944 RepID=UPI00343E1571
MAEHAHLLRWPLVGRDAELEDFTSVWATRRCQSVVISGPMGVGKTRLAEECLVRAVQMGWKGRRATATAASSVVPLGAIAHLLPAGLDLSDPVKGFAAAVSSLAGSPPQRHRRVFLIDDLHLLDAASAMLLRQLLDAEVARLIATVRTDNPVSDAVDALCRGETAHRIDLADWDQEKTERVLRAALDGPLGRRASQELHMASRGNALYLRELVTGALQTGTLVNDGELWELSDEWPVGTPKLRELVGIRLATADPASRPVLELLALCETLPLADAQDVASHAMLVALEATGLIQFTTDRRRTVAQFTHPLYGEVLRAGIPYLRRRSLLLGQVERIQRRGMHRRDDALRVATWRLAATGTADPSLLARAASLARHAHDYSKVIVLLEALPAAHHTTETRLLMGEAFFELGQSEKAEAVLTEADAAVSNEHDKLAVTMARTLNLLFSSAGIDEALTVNEAARTQVTTPGGRRGLLTNEGYLRVLSGQPAAGLALLEEMEVDVEEAVDVNAWLQGALAKTPALVAVGRASEAVTWADHAYATHVRVNEQALRPHPAAQLNGKVLALTESGRLSEARALGQRTFDELAAAHAPLPRVWTSFFLARMEWIAGHPAAARKWYAEAAALARAYGHFRAYSMAMSGLAACAALVGDLHAAVSAQAEHVPRPGMSLFAGEDLLGKAWLHAARAETSRAREVLTEAAEAAAASGLLPAEALFLTDVARLGGAAAVAPRLSALAAASDGALNQARAHFASTLAEGDPDKLLGAAEELSLIGTDLLAAEAATTASAIWRRKNQPRRATAAARQAEASASRCEGASTPLLTPAEVTAALSAREREIALLAAAGTASKDIAAILHLSVRTVDNHLQHAYTKLGVSTRRQLRDVLAADVPSGGNE